MHRVDGRPQVVAHRGSSLSAAEHTLGAYVQALDDGADALECDVRLTADGHLVCVHDRTLKRTANARGVVSTMQLAQLDELDFATWKNPWRELDDEAPDLDVEHRKVLTLRRLLEAVRDYDRPIDLAVETKHPTRYAGLVERRLVELLAEHTSSGATSSSLSARRPGRAAAFPLAGGANSRRRGPRLRVRVRRGAPGPGGGCR